MENRGEIFKFPTFPHFVTPATIVRHHSTPVNTIYIPKVATKNRPGDKGGS
jgi:hypothetical protein